MIDFDFDEYCCGCGACENVCKVNAIRLCENKDGFLIPVIDKSKCVHCNKCSNVCPHINADLTKINTKDPHTWLFSSKDEIAKKNSSSGGAFYELAKYFVDNNGLVCGCAWNDYLEAEHCLVNDLCDLRRLQGSKYVQSRTGDIYNRVLSVLKSGKKVLFSGTPCQCNAMYNIAINYNKGMYKENLYNVAVICHGIATPKAWETYKDWLCEVNKSKLKKVDFRSKDVEGYKKSYCKYEFENGVITYLPTFLPSSKYIEATLVYNLAIRKSCSHCDCKGLAACCDLIIGDWYERNSGEGAMGTSCIVACTESGKELVESVLNDSRKFCFNEVLKKNSFIKYSVRLPEKRKKFLEELNKDIWNDVEKFYPPKYILKKLLCKMGLFEYFKKIKSHIL